jgi:hypothetical protein
MKVSDLIKGTVYDCTNYYGGIATEHCMIYQGRKKVPQQ